MGRVAGAEHADRVADLAVAGFEQAGDDDDRDPGQLAGDRGERQAADQLWAGARVDGFEPNRFRFWIWGYSTEPTFDYQKEDSA
jgi:hypothetical protein